MEAGDRFERREELAPDVWLAHDERLGRDVVLKRAVAGEPRAMARLNHPHVITVYEHVEGWAVLEYAPGGSLAGRTLPVTEAARIGAQIADALAYLHGKGLVHCDVKPGNIVLTDDGVAKLTDFGSAYRVDPEATLTPVSQISFTRAYASPEVMRGSPVPASDVYSLAATVRALAPEVGDALDDLLSANPHDRPDAVAAGRVFQALAAGAHPTVDGGPAQLPADVYGFAGRTAELERLDQVAGPLVVISGTAGVGKTTLAVHWAHRIAGRFPDGQLYVNLRGFDPSGQDVGPADAIRGFLDALGIPPERIPIDLDAQAALYRSTLSAKRMLIVLDNARDADQVRPLLPGNAACQVVVTSRNDLLGLVSKEGARPVTLDVLTDAEARQLLDRRIGPERTAAEPEAVEQIIRSCARLPLALAIVAARAAIRPDFPLAAITLAGDDPETDIRVVFSWSYQQLSPDAQRLFRLLGLHPGPDISAPAATSLFGGRPPLAELTRAHLVEEHTPGRYTFHDLLRAYAGELAATEPDRQAATHRMLDHYLHSTNSAGLQLAPDRDPISLPEPRAGVTSEEPPDLEQAMAWFIAEHPVLLAVVNVASSARFDTHAWKLAWNLITFLYRRGHWHDLAATEEVALSACQRLNDRPALIRAHRNLAAAYTQLHRVEQARTELEHSLDLAQELGDILAQARAHLSISTAYEQQNQYADALHHAQQALGMFRSLNHQRGLALALNAVGWLHAHLGQHEAALTHCEQALVLHQEHGISHSGAETWDSLGYIHHQVRRFEDAISCYQHAVDLARELGIRHFEADVLDRLGDTWSDAGDQDAARQSWEDALAILEELDHPDAEVVRGKLARGAPSAGPVA